MRPNELLRTACCNEITLRVAASVPSARGGAALINRMQWRGEGGAVKYRQFSEAAKREGGAIMAAAESVARGALLGHGFDAATGRPADGGAADPAAANPRARPIPVEQIDREIDRYNERAERGRQIDLTQIHEPFDADESCVNVSVDDVGVVAQKETGRTKGSPPKEHRRYVQNTVVHVQHMAGQSILSALGLDKAMLLLSAFLLKNDLLRDKMLVFFVDGAQELKDAIKGAFGWRPYRIILDWRHLEKKCGERLSMAMKGRALRNEALEAVARQLWLGKTDAAIDALRGIGAEAIRDPAHIDKLAAYIERNFPFIPCYALRKRLGLRISSNRGEKANDVVVAGRQKHQGMSWSKPGSGGMAAICAAIRNRELDSWVKSGSLSFSLNYPEEPPQMAA
jgi:hypothetical protein